MTTIPGTLAATLEPAVLAAIEAALAPPVELRAQTSFEIELEAAGEGTFVIDVKAGKVSAKKGFAKDPLIAVAIPKGGYALLQRELQHMVDGLPNAPELRRYVDDLKRPKPGELDAMVAGLQKIKDSCVRFTVKGTVGTYAVARGPVDEATRVLTVTLDAAEIDGVLAGAPLTSVHASVGGDRGVLSAALAALGPVITRLRR